MPLSMFRRLGLGEARPTTVTLQLADKSLKHPRGVIEDVLVKVDKFIFLSDFIVLYMEKDKVKGPNPDFLFLTQGTLPALQWI